MIRPAKPLPTVAQVTFEGNQVIPQDKLREAIAGAVGASYTEDSFRQILNSVDPAAVREQGLSEGDVSRTPDREGHRRRGVARLCHGPRGRQLRDWAK